MQATPGTSLNDAADPPAAPHRRHTFVLWALVALIAVGLDQATKWWAQSHLVDGRPRHLIGDLLMLRLTHNAGAAFSVATGYTIALTAIALVVLIVIVSMAGRLRSIGWALALGLLFGGALGNVADRIFRAPAPFRGHVVDFIELPHWPIFNVADSAITVAAVLIVVLSLLGRRLDGSKVDDPRVDS